MFIDEHFSYFLKGYHLVINKNLIKNSRHSFNWKELFHWVGPSISSTGKEFFFQLNLHFGEWKTFSSWFIVLFNEVKFFCEENPCFFWLERFFSFEWNQGFLQAGANFCGVFGGDKMRTLARNGLTLYCMLFPI